MESVAQEYVLGKFAVGLKFLYQADIAWSLTQNEALSFPKMLYIYMNKIIITSR